MTTSCNRLRADEVENMNFTETINDSYLNSSGGPQLDVAIWIDPVMLAREQSFIRHLVTALKSEGHRVTFIARVGLDLSYLPTLGSRVVTYRWNRWEKIGVLQRVRLSGVVEEF